MRLLFTGDSITDAGRRGDPGGLGSGFVDMVATAMRAADPATEVLNTGIAGDRVGRLLGRVDADVLAPAPEVCTILIGVNDTLVAFYEGEPTPDAAFDADLAELLARIADRVPELVVLEPFFLDPAAPDVRWAEGAAFIGRHLAARRERLREAAALAGATFVPLQARFDEVARIRGAATLLPDGVHPSPLGHRLIADAWLSARRPRSPG